MASEIIKHKLRQKNASGDYDVFHLETEDSIVQHTAVGSVASTVKKELSALEKMTVSGDVSGTIARTVDSNTSEVKYDINVTVANDSHTHSTYAAKSHAHGDIANGGTIATTAVTPASGDYLLLSDSSNSNKIQRGIAIATNDNKFLRHDGTWVVPSGTYSHPNTSRSDSASTATPSHGGEFTVVDSVSSNAQGHVTAVNVKTVTLPAAYVHPTTTAVAADIYKVGKDTQGHVVLGSKITPADLGLSNAMHFIGTATVTIADGSTTDPAISGYTFKNSSGTILAKAGDVIIDKNSAFEYVWTSAGKWERFGGDGNYSVVGHKHTWADIEDPYVHPTYAGTKTAGTKTLAHSGTFKAIEAVTLANGHVSAYTEKTYTLPAAYVHPTVVPTESTGTAQTLSHGGSVDVVTGVTVGTNGHVSDVETTTVTLPAQYVHPDTTRTNTTSNGSPAHGATFTTVDSVTSDAKGHVTAVNTKTITLPAQYTHPTYAGSKTDAAKNIGAATAGTNRVINAVSAMTLANGHVSAYTLTATTIKTPDIQYGSSQPTDQIANDLWFETI